ncbi:hypothetical protein [Nitrosomonas sp.]|uniref:hypothetical protein n=1 Tax=Nitrosomonas sp. TaxID=42353 RepID=UPI0025CBD6E8|nr:hypothetical protein [Nitrosomonas sp.]
MNSILTLSTFWPHTANASAKYEVGFDRPEPGGQPPSIFERFFYVRNCAFSFMGGLFWGGLTPCRPGSVCQPCYKLPARVSHGWRFFKTVKTKEQ